MNLTGRKCFLTSVFMMLSLFARCSSPSMSFADAPRFDVIDEMDADAPRMQPIDEEDAIRIFGSLIDEKLAPLLMADAAQEAKMQAFEERLAAFEASRIVARAPAPPPKVTVTQSVAPVKTSSGPHWTYPGDITSHLQSDKHGYIDTTGMTIEQQLSLHDSLHNTAKASVKPASSTTTYTYSYPVSSLPMSTQTTSSSYSGPLVQRSRTTTSSCPGGVCPTRPQSRGLFRWR